MRVVLLAVLTVCAMDGYGQRTKRFDVKINLFSTAAVKTFNLIPEYAITQRWCAQVGFYRTNNFHFREHVFSGMAITPEVKFHLTSTYLKGVYVSTLFRYRKLSWDIPSKGVGADFISLGGGFSMGYQFLIKNFLVVDLFIGPVFSSHDLKVKTGVVDDFKLGITAGVGVRSGIGLGIAF